MLSKIPYDRWDPLSVNKVSKIFACAPFEWGLAGGYAVEQFVGQPVRTHGDIDILIFRDEQLKLYEWLADWKLYAADPPGTLRPWSAGEHLAYGIHDIWGHRYGVGVWQLQIMLAETDGEEWFSRHHNAVRGLRRELFVTYQEVSCLRIEVQMLYKSRNCRPKDEVDFEACLPRLSVSAREWLLSRLCLLHPQGHVWINRLARQDDVDDIEGDPDRR